MAKTFNLKIDINDRYFSFDYRLWLNDEFKVKEEYSDDHTWVDK